MSLRLLWRDKTTPTHIALQVSNTQFTSQQCELQEEQQVPLISDWVPLLFYLCKLSAVPPTPTVRKQRAIQSHNVECQRDWKWFDGLTWNRDKVGRRLYEEKLCRLKRKRGLMEEALVGAIYCISCCELKHLFWITNRMKQDNFS